ncbi:MAG: RHS repeat-associated core domain-containing protein [Candidatus Omnitrophota bacterium]|nr:RHS repeat-associated core domain-containing protein [Candidatus Omnitrophota bacterium]
MKKLLFGFLSLFIGLSAAYAAPDGKLHVYATGSYEVWAGNSISKDELDSHDFYENINVHGGLKKLTPIGNGVFPGEYRYYVIATTTIFSLDAILLPNGKYPKEEYHSPGKYFNWGNVHAPLQYNSSGFLINPNSHDDYIYGPPDGKTDDVGAPIGHDTILKYEGYIVAENYIPFPSDPHDINHRGENPDSVGDPIDPVVGNMYLSAIDLSFPGKNLSFTFKRSYNSRQNTSGPLGYGWTHSYNVRAVDDADEVDELDVALMDEEDKAHIFTIEDSLPQRGEHSTVTKAADGVVTWTKKDGMRYIFPIGHYPHQIKDRWDNTVTLTYNTQNQLVNITDSAGRVAELRYDGQGRITSLSMAGRNIDYRYDNQGNLVDVTDPAGNHTSYEYDANHNLTRKTDAAGRSTYFTYDSSDRCTSSSGEGNLGRTELSFDPDNKKTVVTDSKGNTTHYSYSDDLQITEIVNAQGGHAVSTWDKDLNRTSSTDELGRATYMQYDAKGNLISLTGPAGDNTTYTYEPNFSLVTTIKDAQGNVTTNAYDARGNLIKVTDALGKSTFYSYNGAGLVTGSQNALGKTTYFSYDAQGNLIQTKDAVGAVVNNGYDAIGNMTSSRDPKGNITNFSYNNLNCLVQAAYSDNSTVNYGYDTVGNRISATDQLGKTTYYTYNQADKVISTTNALGSVISYTYDTEENLICVADQNNNKTSFSYDGLNRLVSQTDALGNTTSYSYDAVGNRTSVTDAKGQVTRYDYDSLNRLSKTTNPDSTTITYVYDSLGRRTSMTDPSGITTYAYDKLGRLLKVDGPLAKDTITYTYDAMGNRLTMVDPDAKTTTYFYDVLNRISFITDPQKKVTSYVFDLNGNLTTLTYPNGTKAVYSYDKLNHLVTLTNLKTASPSTKLSEYTYAYDLAGRKTRAALLDGSSITYTYDAIGQLLNETKSSTVEPYSFTYAYDPAGNRTRKTVNNDDYNYSYNSLNQLIQEDTRILSSSGPKKITVSGKVSDKSFIDYVTVNGIKATLGSDAFTCANVPLSLGQNTITVIAADVLGNTTTKVLHVTYEPGVTTTQTKYTYDANGNLTRKEEPSKTTNLTYDSQNRLKTFTNPASSATYAYDGQGRRISKTVNGSTTTYIYDNDELIREQSGSTVISYTHGSRIDEIISDSRGYYYHYDALGSITNLTNASGAQVNSYNYEAFGNLTGQTGIISNPWLFTGRQYDQESGLYFYRNRYYDPTIGRFISQDPTGMVDGPNLYAYVKNNPVNLIDPLGLCWKKIYDAVALVQARIELFLNKGLHFPVHLLAEITDAYGPMDTPVTFFLNRYNPTQPLVNLLAEQTLSPLDIALENSIIAWENHIDYLEGKK